MFFFSIIKYKNFNTINVSNSIDMFYDINNNLIYCAEETKISSIQSLLSNYVNNCSYFCFNQQHKYILFSVYLLIFFFINI